ELAPDRDILEVGVRRRNTPRRRDRLLPGAVHASGLWVHERRERIDVRSLELRDLAMLQDDLGQRVFFAERLEGLRIRRAGRLRAAERLQLELIEQNRLELPR